MDASAGRQLSPWRWVTLAVCWLAAEALSIHTDQGGPRAFLLGLFAAAAVYLLTHSPSPTAAAPSKGHAPNSLAWGVLAALTAVHIAWFAAAWLDPHPRLVDIGLTTLDAARAILRGQDPYTLPIDPQGAHGLRGFDGYKYTPVMALAYAPLGAALGTRGLLLTNLLTDLAVAAAVGRLARRTGAVGAGRLAASLYLSLPVIPQQLFQEGVTDLVPVLALLVGLIFQGRSALFSGFFMGLSVAAKPFPGVIAAAYGLGPKERLTYLAGCAAGMLPVGVMLVHSGRALIDDTLLFNLARSPDATAWLAVLPSPAPMIGRLLVGASLIGGALMLWLRGGSLHSRCCCIVIGVIATILAGAAAHTNYMLWWLPAFFAVLAAALWREGDGPSSVAPREGVGAAAGGATRQSSANRVFATGVSSGGGLNGPD